MIYRYTAGPKLEAVVWGRTLNGYGQTLATGDQENRGMRLREAFAHMRARRPVVWPNRGFMERLIACEAKLGHSPPSLSMAEYDAWCEFDIEEYQKASVIDR